MHEKVSMAVRANLIQIKPGEAERLKLLIPYDATWVAKIKAILGRRWHPEEKCWSVPHSEESSHAYVNQCISALKFLYEKVLKQPSPIVNLPRPKRERKLPDILSRQEVLRLSETVENSKHRVIMLLTYSAGLRLGEVVRLRAEDIDSERRLIHIRQAKGRKDRDSEYFADSQARHNRLRELLGGAQMIDVEMVKQAMSDHEGGVCSHKVDSSGRKDSTIWSVVARPGEQQVDIAEGHPCRAKYRTVNF